MSSEPWFHQFARYRAAKGWSLADAARVFVTLSPLHTDDQVESMRRAIARWEKGAVSYPSPENQAVIAKMFDLPVGAMFPARPLMTAGVPQRLQADEWAELMGQLRDSQITPGTLDAAEREVERLCTAYAAEPAEVVLRECDEWGRRLIGMRPHLDLRGLLRTYEMAGRLSLLRSCLLYDLRDHPRAEAARQMAADLGKESGNGNLVAWSYEISAWVALTSGDLSQAVASAEAGVRVAPNDSVAAQLHAQAAKAYARLGDHHKTEVALERVRLVLDGCETPTNVRNHFVVDPTKANFYAMDAYRVLGCNDLAGAMAETVVATSTTPDGEVISPMRLAEARLTQAVIAARSGDVSTAASVTVDAMAIQRQSIPSLLMVAREVAREIGKVDPTMGREFTRDALELTK